MFSFIDIIFLSIIIYAAYQGYKKGFIIHFFTLLALFVGLYVSIYFSEFVQEKIKTTFELKNNLPYSICFTICFLAVGAMVFFAGKAIEKLIKIAMLSSVNKIAGSIFAVLKYTFILSGIIYFFSIYDTNSVIEQKDSVKKSLLYKPIKNLLTFSIPKYKQLYKEEENSLKSAEVIK